MFFDLTFLPLVETIAAQCASVKTFVLMCDRDRMPGQSGIANLLCYEGLIDSSSADYSWPQFDENAASDLCYTSGTTGHPKGVLYSHRSTLLRAYASAMPDALNISACDVVLPMFHVNAWGLPYTAPLTGAKLVLSGHAIDGKSLYELFEQEQVTWSAGVPTVWLGLLTHMQQNRLRFSSFKRVVIGGSACPPAMRATFRQQHGVDVVHSWGMTELSPLGTACRLQTSHLELPQAEQNALLEKILLSIRHWVKLGASRKR